MASIKILRRRIKSIQGTAKITRAMEMITTAKLRRTQQQALAGRPYSEKIRQVIADLAVEPRVRGGVPPLLQRREVRKIYIILLTTDRGLCGGLNTNVNRMVAKFILDQKVPVHLIVVGRKGRSFARNSGLHIYAEFTGLGDRTTIRETLPISRIVIEDYSKGEVDLVYLAYPRFFSTMVQKPSIDVLLPMEPAQVPAGQIGEYIYEPSASAVLNELLPRFVEMQVYHGVLELIASEQSARMVAMRNASEAAQDMIESLTLTLNKARQESITKEISEITGGAEVFQA
jgi:F-type H+-transporting ATPase subunit gamma